MWEAILDAFLDTLKALPVLYLVYLLVAFFSHKNCSKKLFSKRATGPLVASALGQIPQCGFSSAMADLYSKKAITVGTLVAVFIATSDEALPLMFSRPDQWLTILLVVGIKFVAAVACGYLIDLILYKSQKVEPVAITEKCECEISHEEAEKAGHSSHAHCHDHCCADNIFLHALKHALSIALYMLIASIIINLLVYFIGLDTIQTIFVTDSAFQPLLLALMGLIPNCAVSVLIVELFFSNVITFSSMIAGLCSGAGLGMIVLFTKNKNLKQNLGILGLTFASAVAVGYICFLIELAL